MLGVGSIGKPVTDSQSSETKGVLPLYQNVGFLRGGGLPRPLRGRGWTQITDSLALAVLQIVQCCHDATVSKHNKHQTTWATYADSEHLTFSWLQFLSRELNLFRSVSRFSKVGKSGK